jgi:hypothetical protein
MPQVNFVLLRTALGQARKTLCMLVLNIYLELEFQHHLSLDLLLAACTFPIAAIIINPVTPNAMKIVLLLISILALS